MELEQLRTDEKTARRVATILTRLTGLAWDICSEGKGYDVYTYGGEA